MGHHYLEDEKKEKQMMDKRIRQCIRCGKKTRFLSDGLCETCRDNPDWWGDDADEEGLDPEEGYPIIVEDDWDWD